jgi:hypothetical protein
MTAIPPSLVVTLSRNLLHPIADRETGMSDECNSRGVRPIKLTRPFELAGSHCFRVCSYQPGAYHSAEGADSRVVHLARDGAGGACRRAEGKWSRTRHLGGTKYRYISKHVGSPPPAIRCVSDPAYRRCIIIIVPTWPSLTCITRFPARSDIWIVGRNGGIFGGTFAASS